MMIEDVEPRLNQLTDFILRAAVGAQRDLGVGLLEKPYRVLLAHRLREAGLHVAEEVPLRFEIDGLRMENAYRLDLLVEDSVVVELKAVESLNKVHLAQMLTYLRLSRRSLGLLLNFRTLPLGIRRVVLSEPAVAFAPSAPSAASAVAPQGRDEEAQPGNS